MAAFFVSFLVAGWRPGQTFPDGAPLYAASGAAFLAVVLGQKANAWACRSATLSPWRLGWFGNRMLVYTAAGEMMFAISCFVIPQFASALGQQFPSAAGLAVAMTAIPAVWFVDFLNKRRRHRRNGRRAL
jgi:magnesium-transporting ATPase (P-type)